MAKKPTTTTTTKPEEFSFMGKALLEIEREEIDKMDKDMLELYASKMCPEYNSAYADRNEKSASEIDDLIVFAVNKYTSISRKECFDRMAESENPMISAVTEMYYDTIRICDQKEGKEIKVTVRSIVKSKRPIDLLKLHKHIPGGIGADKNWVNIAEYFNCLCTCRVAVRIGFDGNAIKRINDSYAMSSLARQVGEGKTPTSNTQMLKELTKVIQAMIGSEYKAVSHDVGYLDSVYSKVDSSNLLRVKCSNHSNMRKYLMAICNRVVTNTPYSIAYPELKNK